MNGPSVKETPKKHRFTSKSTTAFHRPWIFLEMPFFRLALTVSSSSPGSMVFLGFFHDQ